MIGALPELFPDAAEVVCVALEFGTYAAERLMQTQIDDSWMRSFGAGDEEVRQSIQRSLVEFFLPADPAWRSKVVQRTGSVVSRLIQQIQA